jgi:predicted TIM-barrel fold metal-dependent hydrolase
MSMQIIDTHQHLWDPGLFRYLWLQSVPSLNRPFRMPDYLEAIQGQNVVKSVHLEADVDKEFMLDETRHLLDLADRLDNPLAGIVACARPEEENFRTHVDKIADHPKVKGIRRVLHTQPDEVGRSRTFVRNIASLKEYGLTFDLCVLARQLPIAIHLASICPQVMFILDHCGVPQVKERIFHPWRSDIEEIAKLPNVYCKISGLVAYADPKRWTEDNLRPYVEHVISCFGWDRVLFGSDWPVCTLSASYKQWLEALLSLTRNAGAANQRKLFHDNAIRVYRLE